jgi:hypothetical protein
MNIYLSHSELSDDTSVRAVKELKRHCNSVVNMRWSYMNNKSTRWAEASSTVDEEQGRRDMPAIRQAVHSGRHKGAFIGHQMDVASFQVQLSIRSNTPGDGVMRWHHGDRVYDRCSNTNDEYKEKLTNSSIRLQERSTTLYSLARRPKGCPAGR